MTKLLLIILGAAALVGAAALLQRRWASLPPADHTATPGQNEAARRLRYMQYALGALPVAAFFVLANGDLLLAMELLGVWLVVALGLTLTGIGLRKVAEGEAWLPQALTGAMLVTAGVDAALLIATVPWWLAAMVAGAVLVGMLAALDHWPWDEVRNPDRARGRRRLAAFRSAAAGIGEPDLRRRAVTLATEAGAVLDGLSDGPAARRFLGIWLRGARDATAAFVKAEGWHDAGAKARFEALLGTLEEALGSMREKMRASDRAKLDVEIEVLTERLGVAGLR